MLYDGCDIGSWKLEIGDRLKEKGDWKRVRGSVPQAYEARARWERERPVKNTRESRRTRYESQPVTKRYNEIM